MARLLFTARAGRQKFGEGEEGRRGNGKVGCMFVGLGGSVG